jgi:hypothetical protein
MLSIALRRWYINLTITILDIIHRPVFYLKHSFSQTESNLRVQVVPTQLDLTDGNSDYLCRLDTTEKVLPEDGDKIQSPKYFVLNKRQYDGQCPEL